MHVKKRVSIDKARGAGPAGPDDRLVSVPLPVDSAEKTVAEQSEKKREPDVPDPCDPGSQHIIGHSRL